MDALTELAGLTAEADVPEDVRAKTALILADTIGAIVGGADEAEVRALTARVAAGSRGDAVVIGPGGRMSAGSAAFLNGVAGTTLEMDEGNRFCKGHPGVHVIPAALAMAKGTSGATLLSAIAVGYEAAARVGIATRLRPAMHPHGTWGAIGATVAAMRLRGLGAAAHREGMTIAASLGLSTSRRTMLEGGTVRNVFAGVSNRMGVLTVDLVDTGYTGDWNGVGEVFGRVVSDEFDEGALVRDPGEVWNVARNYFKMHSCCRFNHAALDALDRVLAGEPDTQPGDIVAVSVDSYAFAAELNDPAPRNVLAGKFSVPFAVATRIVTGSSGVESFSAARVADPVIRALAGRVTVREDAAMTAALPERRPARVTLTLANGRMLSAAVETNRGDESDPYSEAELYSKFMALTARLWSASKAEAVWQATLELDGAGDVAGYLDMLAE